MNYPQPFGERVLIKRKSTKNATQNGIILSASSEVKNEGEIVAIGEDRKDFPMRVNVGQKVLFTGYGIIKVEIDEDRENDYVMMSQNEILALLN